MEKRGQINSWILILFIIIGIIMVIFGIFYYFHQVGFIKNSITTNGTVTKNILQNRVVNDRYGSHNEITYCPEIQFTTNKGEVTKFQSGYCTNPPDYKIGQNVNIRYDPNNPTNAQINSILSLYGFSALAILLGIIFIGFSIIILIRYR